MFDRIAIKDRARMRVREYRGTSIGVYVLFGVLMMLVARVSYGIGNLFLAPPLAVGYYLFYVRVWQGRQPAFETLFEAFGRYTQALIAMLWMWLWTFLWSLLLIVPGIVKAISYSMTPYLVAEYPDLDPRRALMVSMEITDGHKMEIFVMRLSFFGWHLLSGLTFGILEIVHVGPYQEIALAGMYEALLADALAGGRIHEEDLRR